MVLLVNRAKMSTATTGTGTITLGAAESGYQTFADAGVTDSDTVRYVIEDSDDWEIGTGTYTASGTTLSRTVLASSNSDSAINLSGNAVVFVSATAEDILQAETDVATFLSTPSSANLAAAVTDETGSGDLVFATSPTLVTPNLGTPASGNLSDCTVDGTNAVGFRIIPQNSQSSAYTLVASDSGKHILHPSADTTPRTFTIPANSSVAFPVGTAITFINQNGAGDITIAITTDTMRLADEGTTGSRTLSANGVATAIKITATEWIISGVGLT